jgi:hypothetical protein
VRPLAAFLAGSCTLLSSLALLAGCGVRAPDLFLVKRSGGAPRATLVLLVDDQGGVRCNGGPQRKLSDRALIEARAIEEDLRGPSSAHTTLPARPQSVFAYFVREQAGWVRFHDNSPRQPKVFRELALFALKTAQGVCGLPQ